MNKTIDDSVIGGSVNGSGTLHIKVTGTCESGYLAQVMGLVTAASQDTSKAESLADKVAQALFYIAIVIGIITLVVWTLLQGFNTGIERMVTVLVIAYSHALGLAIPLVSARSTSLGAQNGLLIKSRMTLENADKITYVLLDKTGTLTEGNFEVNAIESFNNKYTQYDILSLFSSFEQSSSHPRAQGILRKAEAEGVTYEIASNVETLAGIGLEGELKGDTLKVVNLKYLKNTKLIIMKRSLMNLLQQVIVLVTY